LVQSVVDAAHEVGAEKPRSIRAKAIIATGLPSASSMTANTSTGYTKVQSPLWPWPR